MPVRPLLAVTLALIVPGSVFSTQTIAQGPEKAAAASDAKSISLFNGKDLTGWHVDVPHLDEHPDAKATFVVRDGFLVSLGEPAGLLITDAKYEDYRVVVEYRFAAKPGDVAKSRFRAGDQ